MAITKSWHIQINDTNYFLELREKDDFYVLSNLEDPTYLLKIPTQDLFLLTKDLQNIANSNKSSIKTKSTVESFTEQEKSLSRVKTMEIQARQGTKNSSIYDYD